MTRILTTGWETNDLNEPGGTYAGAATQSIVTSTPTPRSPGSYCYKIAATGAQVGGRTWTFAASKTEVWVRFGYYAHWSSGEHEVCSFYDSAGTVQGCVTWSSANLFIRAYRGQANQVLIGTSTSTMSADAWHVIEVRWQITSATVGTTEVWIDGSRYLNLTSVDNTSTANLNIQRFGFGFLLNFFAAGEYFAVDDLAINDASGTINNGQIYDGRVVLLKPNGAGSNTNQTRGGTDSGANWSQVDEIPPSLTDYVYSAVGDGTKRDTYTLEDIPSGSWSVNCVEVLAFAQNSDAGAGALGLTVKSGSTTNEGTAQNLTISSAYYRQLYETDPNTSAAWTNAAVNALEAGTTVR